MISNSKQVWTTGATVKVGFISGLLVVAAIATPGDYAPDAYILSRNNQFYSFVPHKGLTKIELSEATEMIAASRAQADRDAKAAIAKAAESARHAQAVKELMMA